MDKLQFEVVDINKRTGTVTLKPLGRLKYALPTAHGFHFHKGQVLEGPIIKASDIGRRRVVLPTTA